MSLVTKAKNELDSKTANAEELWTKFEEAKAAADADDSVSEDTISELETLHNDYVTAASQAAAAKSKWETVVSMNATTKTEEKKSGHSLDAFNTSGMSPPETDGKLTIVGTPEFKHLQTSGSLNSGAKIPSGLHLATANAEFKAIVGSLTRTANGNMGQMGALGGRLLNILDIVPIDGNSVSYVRQTARSGQATNVAEGANKPESNFAAELVNAPLENIAVWKQVSRQALADDARFNALIEGALTDDLILRLEAQILTGNGTTPNLDGIMGTAGVGAYEATATENRADAILQGLTQIAAAGGVPDAVVLHPTDFAAVRLEKDDNGAYIFGYPNMPGTAEAWGVPLIVSTAVTPGTAVAGAFKQGATLYTQGGVEVHTTDSHASTFIANVITVLVEQRAALAVEVPSLFSTIELVNTP